jgi:hypothetical protein
MKNRSTQSDTNMNFDGMESMKVSRSAKYMTNQWSGHMNDGRLVQKAQAPNRTGNDAGGGCPGQRTTDAEPPTCPRLKFFFNEP